MGMVNSTGPEHRALNFMKSLLEPNHHVFLKPTTTQTGLKL